MCADDSAGRDLCQRTIIVMPLLRSLRAKKGRGFYKHGAPDGALALIWTDTSTAPTPNHRSTT